MSWGMRYPCWYCQRAENCTDLKHISDGVQKAHEAENHAGGGNLIMDCMNVLPYPKPAPPEAEQPDKPEHPPKIIDRPLA